MCSVAACDDEDEGGIRLANNPDLSVRPPQVVINPPPIGESITEVVNLLNSGDGNLRIISLNFSNELSGLEFEKEHPELPIILGPGENADINIIYSPQDAGEDRGKLVIESNSRSGRITEVDIFTQDGASELVFAAQTLFGVGEDRRNRRP